MKNIIQQGHQLERMNKVEKEIVLELMMNMTRMLMNMVLQKDPNPFNVNFVQ